MEHAKTFQCEVNDQTGLRVVVATDDPREPVQISIGLIDVSVGRHPGVYLDRGMVRNLIRFLSDHA